MIKIAIIDDNKIARLGIRSLLTDDEIEIVGEANDGASGIKLVLEKLPDVVLLDLYLPDVLGIQVCHTIARQAPKSKVIFISSCKHLYTLTRLLHTPAKGIISKDSHFSGVEAVKCVYDNKKYIQPDLAYELLQCVVNQNSAGYHNLKEMEHQVLIMVSQGKTHAQIAENLCITTKTVANVKFRGLKKLGISNANQLPEIFFS